MSEHLLLHADGMEVLRKKGVLASVDFKVDVSGRSGDVR